MKKEFPFYKSSLNGKRVNPSALIEEKLKPSDKKILKDFLLFCSINSSGKKRAENYKRVMLQFKDFLEKDLGKVNNKDFLHFAETIKRSKRTINGKNDVRDIIKKFGYWIEDKQEIKFSNLKLIKFEKTQGSNKIKSPNDLITELEFDKLIRATSNLMHKTLICLLWESAGRPEEVLKLRWNDIDFIKKNVKLHSAKTGRFRIVPLDLTINHLKRLREEVNFDNEDYIFTSQKRNKLLQNASFNFILKRLSEKAGIKKYISGYTFRHTRLTSLIKTLSPKSYEMISGHSLQMGMKTYAHLNVDDLTKEMEEKIFGVEELSKDEKSELAELRTKQEAFEKKLDFLESLVGKENKYIQLLAVNGVEQLSKPN